MTNPDYTAIAVLVDKSGSMNHIANDMSDGLRAFIEEQKALPGKCTVRLDEFSSGYGNVNAFNYDSGYRSVYKSVDISEAPDYTLRAGGGTALNDAWVRTIESFGTELRALKEKDRPGKVLFIVITDGEENSSTSFRKEDVKARVEEQTNKYGWDFVYLGANLDAVSEGASYGVAKGSTMDWATNSTAVASASASLSSYAGSLRSAGTAEFTDDDRDNAVASDSE